MTRELTSQLRSVVTSISGIVGLAARNLGTGEEVHINSGLVFPLASTFKVPLLLELLRLAELGSVDLGARFSLSPEARVFGSGVLKELDPGLQPTVRDLAVLMIILSDNWATDMLANVVGLDNVNRTLRVHGIEEVNVVLNCTQILARAAGIVSDNPSAEELELARQRLEAAELPPDSPALSEGSDNNVATPRGFASLLTMLAERRYVSPWVCEQALDIMKRQQLRQRIPLLLPLRVKVANKTGTLGPVRNDAGIIFGARATVALAVFTKKVADPIAADRVIADCAHLLFEAWAGYEA
ncbi:MAG: class A beta-lactamase-related serine hydrolase [Bacillota bacterium]|nr:class A beta-lactamase-related serine hydrolase [Bacillota bacterium]